MQKLSIKSFGDVYNEIKSSVLPNNSSFIINLDHLQQLLFHTIPQPLDQYDLFWSYKKRAPKPLLGGQNWATSTGGRPG